MGSKEQPVPGGGRGPIIAPALPSSWTSVVKAKTNTDRARRETSRRGTDQPITSPSHPLKTPHDPLTSEGLEPHQGDPPHGTTTRPPTQSTDKSSTATSIGVNSTAGTTTRPGTTGTRGTDSLSGTTLPFNPKVAENVPSTPAPNLFRANGNLVTNHFQVQFGNAQTIYNYSLNIVQVHPAPAAQNTTIIRRIRRRVVYLFTQELMHGAVTTLPANPPQPLANPTPASDARTPATGAQAQAVDDQGQKGVCDAKSAAAQGSNGGDSRSSSVPQPVLKGTLLASDYHDTLVTLTKIPDQHLDVAFRLNYYEDWENGPSTNPMQFRVTMSFLSQFEPHQMLQDLANPQQSNVTVGGRDSFLRTFNILFSHRANLRTFQDVARQRIQLTALTSSKKFFDLFPPNTTAQQPPALAPWRLNAAMDALPGYFLSCRAVINGNLILNVNTMTSAFYQHFAVNRNLHGLITALENLPHQPLRREVQAHLKNIRVKTNYLVQHGGAREVCYSIIGIPNAGNQWPTAGNVRTRVVDPTTQLHLTVEQYFQQTYPHANVGPNDRVVSLGRNVIIPARLLQVLRGSPVKQKTDMVRHAVRMPDINRQMIENEGKTLFGFIPTTAQNVQQPARLFADITIDQDLLSVAARMLIAPNVGYAAQRAIQAEEARTGFWNLKQRQFVDPYRAPENEYWSYLQLQLPANYRHTPYDDLQDWSAQISQSLEQYGIKANLYEEPRPGAPHYMQVSRQQDQTAVSQDEANIQAWIQDTQKYLIDHVGADRRQPLKILFVLLPEHSVSLYALVKRVADQICGVPTICHVSRGRRRPKLRNPKRFDQGHGRGGRPRAAIPNYWGPDSAPGFLANLFMKFNLKANENGANQALLTNAPILDDDTMLMGADVTHAGAGAMLGAPSIAAVVGSVDGHFSQFPASFRQNLRQTPTGKHKVGLPNEEILSLAAMVKERIEAYMRRRNKAPRKLIFYRDGLSEAQLDMCTDNELPQIRQGIQQAMIGAWKNSPEPQVMLICTIKRHHARLFQDPKQGQPDQNMFFDHGNPLPGCMVSDGITLDKGKGDFFLVSHEAIKGTARPTHYVVLANDNNEHLNDIACMTNSLCYLFQRATRSVSLAPPSYYADLAADRARHYVRDIYAPFPNNQGVTWTAANHPMNLYVHNHLTDNMFYI